VVPVVLLVAYAAAMLAIDQVVGRGGQAVLGLATADVTGLYLSRVTPVARHARGFVRLALLLGAAWGALGLSGTLGSVDVFGAVGAAAYGPSDA
jgi:hypothetical protein